MRSFSLSVTLKLNTGTTSVYNVLHGLSILLYESSQGTAKREAPAAGLARRAASGRGLWLRGQRRRQSPGERLDVSRLQRSIASQPPNKRALGGISQASDSGHVIRASLALKASYSAEIINQ